MPDPATPHAEAGDASSVVLLLTTFPDREQAEEAAHAWVESGLAACVHIAGAGRSIYRWQGEVESAEEVSVTVKTTSACLAALHQALRQVHPYELPEVLLVSPAGGAEAYLDWVRGSCVPPPGPEASS